jgi:AcrR family transcriptional regulator
MRTHLLDAAERVILRDGALALTLDAVVKEASTSKGGLTHHFPTREALIADLARRLWEGFVGSIEKCCVDSVGPGAWIRAYLTCSFDEDSHTLNMYQRIQPLLGYSPELLQLEEEYFSYIEKMLSADGIPIGKACVIISAAEGVSESGFTRPFKEDVRTALFRLLDEAVAEQTRGL